MSKRMVEIAPFLGIISSLDPRSIQHVYATDMLNVRIEDGTLKPRYGYRNISAIPANFVAPYGLDYIQGYNGSNAEIEEFLSFEDISGTCKPYSINPTTGVRTVLTNGGSALSLHKSTWRSVAWQDKSYSINPNDTYPVYRHTIGTASSFTPLRIPTAPTTRLTYTISYGGTSTPYSQLSFTGVNVSTHVTYTGRATASGSTINSDGSFTFYTSGSGADGSVEIDIGAGLGANQDWTYNDCFAVSLTSVALALNPSSIRITLINASGTSLVPTKQDWVNNGMGNLVTNGILRWQFDDKTRAMFGAVKKIKLQYTITNSSGNAVNNRLTLGKPTIGGVIVRRPSERIWNEGLSFSYSYYYSGADFESGVCQSWLSIPKVALEGISPGQNLPGLGVHITLTATASADPNVDNYRFYVFDPEAVAPASGWLRLATVATPTTTHIHRISWSEAQRLTGYQEGAYTLANVTCAAPFKGWMVWGYKGGYQNIRHSRIGEPEKQASNVDLVSDLNRGATFSLADNYADTPTAMFQAGDALIICGDYGVYAQVGDRPSTMTPPKKLPGSAGVANGLAACRWKDDAGNPGVIFLSRYGDAIYFAQVFSNFDGAEGFRLVELSQSIRGLLVSFLRDGQSLTDFSTARVAVDDATDSLWVIMGKRALVLRRPSLVDGNRQWECYEYSLGTNVTIPYVAFSTKRRQVWMRSAGQLDENEYNSSTGLNITGSNRDGGNAISSIYWQSKVFTGQNRRIADIYLERDSYTDTPTVTVTSSRQTASKTFSSGKRFLRCSPLQQGWEHQYKIALAENSSPIRRMVVTEYVGIGKRLEA